MCSQVTQNKHADIKNLVLFDSDSNITMFKDKKSFSNIKESASTVSISTNRKENLKAMTACEVPNLKFKSYFNTDSMTKIISLVDMEKNYLITMDTGIDKAMHVHMKDKVVRFWKMHYQLCSLNPELDNAYAPEKCRDNFNEN